MKTKEMKALKVISRNEKIVSKELKAVGKPSRKSQSNEECTELRAEAKVDDSDRSKENAENLDPNVASGEENATDPQNAKAKNPPPKVSSAARRKELLEACTGKSVEVLIYLVSSSQVKEKLLTKLLFNVLFMTFFYLCNWKETRRVVLE